MNARRLLWIVLLVAAATMLVTLVLDRKMRSDSAATQPATATAPSAATRPSATRPAPTDPAVATVPTAKSAPTPPAAVGSAPASTPATQTQPGEPVKWTNKRQSHAEVYLGSLDSSTGYKMQVQLTTLGASIKTVKLSEFFATVKDKRRHDKDPGSYDQAVAAHEDDLKGHFSLLNPVGEGGDLSYPMCTVSIYFPADQTTLEVDDNRWVPAKPVTDPDGVQSVTFTSQIDRNGQPWVRLEKTYTLPKGSFSLGVSLKVVNLSGRDLQYTLVQMGPTGIPREDIQSDGREMVYAQFIDNKQTQVWRKPVLELPTRKLGMPGMVNLGRNDTANPTLWAGIDDRYFGSLLYIKPDNAELLWAPTSKADFVAVGLQETPNSRVWQPGLILGPFERRAREDTVINMDLFAGPKDRNLFENPPPGAINYKELKYRDSINFGSCCTWTPLSLGMMWLLDIFSRFLTFGNYGLAIILLVLLTRLALHPLTKKGQVSMMKMQKLQPQMAALREKYKDDKPKLNEEMMKFYKQSGSTPILGCLPMLLQMPIWVALWTALQADVSLRQAAFLPIWITNLAAPDALITWSDPMLGYSLPMNIGPIYGFNLLPLLLTVGMFFQQKLTPTAPATTDQQAMTQKQMLYFMPAFMLVIFYNAPSGLTLYIMASTFGGILEQYVIRKHIKERQAAEAASETQVSVPGGFRGHKPKRPKLPFKF